MTAGTLKKVLDIDKLMAPQVGLEPTTLRLTACIAALNRAGYQVSLSVNL